MVKIVCNPFVHRQTPDSPYSHYAGSWESLELLAELYFENAKSGYKDGVKLVSVPAHHFYTGIVEVRENTQLVVTFKARRSDEAPFIDVTAKGVKAPAGYVDLVVYDKATLGADASVIFADYEIVSINARLYETPEPMTPMAMARNFLELPGGTKATYSAKEFAESILFWFGGHVMRAE